MLYEDIGRSLDDAMKLRARDFSAGLIYTLVLYFVQLERQSDPTPAHQSQHLEACSLNRSKPPTAIMVRVPPSFLFFQYYTDHMIRRAIRRKRNRCSFVSAKRKPQTSELSMQGALADLR
jgi:hypothetical protein